jgi:hypothetical protein
MSLAAHLPKTDGGRLQPRAAVSELEEGQFRHGYMPMALLGWCNSPKIRRGQISRQPRSISTVVADSQSP